MLKKAFGIGIALCLALLCIQPALAAEVEATTALGEDKIAVVNNIAGVPDTITISSIVSGDVIKVYATETSSSAIAVSKSTGTSVVIYTEQLGKAEGSVYVTITSSGKSESTRTAKSFSAESQYSTPVADNVTVANNITGILDTVTVSGLTENDILRVYATATATSPIAVARSAAGGSAVAYIGQLGTGTGSVFVSLQSSSKLESARTEKTYSAESGTTALNANQITVTNKVVGSDDTVVVTGLVEGDIIKVYATSTSTEVLGTATVVTPEPEPVEEGEDPPPEPDPVTTVTINITQLGTASGKVYVTVTKDSSNESARTEASYTAETTVGVEASTVTVTNNYVGTNDTVAFTGLVAGDIVKVYATTSATEALGTATVASEATTATVSIEQLGSAAGKVYVTVKKADKVESARTAVSYTAEPTTTAPSADVITVTNNITGSADTIAVTGIAQGDVVKVYATRTATEAIGTATVANGATSATISINQIGIPAGKVYVTVKNTNKLESTRTEKAYTAEAATTALTADQITVTNKVVGSNDIVAITGLAENDIIKVYATATSTEVLGTATVTTPEPEEGEDEPDPVTSVTISIAQLSTTSGRVYVTITKSGSNESARTEASYTAEKSVSVAASTITVTNNYVGTDDTVVVTGLVTGDVVKVYATSTATETLGTATVAADATSATVTIAQIGSAAGKVYVTITKADKAESARTAVAYVVEPTTTAVLADVITVTNNITGVADTIAVTGIAQGDVVKVYATKTASEAIGTATVANGATSATVSINQIGVPAGKVYVSVKNSNKLESLRTEKSYTAESATTALTVDKITVTNKVVGSDDTVVVTGLSEGDVVKVYASATSTEALVTTAPVAEGATTATATIAQLGTASGKVYVTVKSAVANESIRTAASYTAEKSVAPLVSSIVITNKYTGTSDTIVVSGLDEGDVVKVYATSTSTEALKSGTVAEGATSVTMSIAQLSTTAGKVYVTVTSTDKAESSRVAATYTTEPTTTAPALNKITVTNKYSAADTVVVTGLTEGVVVKVYASSTATEALGTATVAEGATSVTISIDQIATGAGKVYVTLKEATKLESARTAAAYTSETSIAPSSANTLIINNTVGTNDSITIAGLKAGDVVKIYDAATNGNVIGTATVGDGKTSVVISIEQLGTGAGKVYISVTSTNKAESAKIAKAYFAE